MRIGGRHRPFLGASHRSSDCALEIASPGRFRRYAWSNGTISRPFRDVGTSSSAGLCPIARRIRLDSDYKQIVLIRLTVGNSAKRPEVATHGSDRKLLIGCPNLLGRHPGSMTAYVDCASKFEVRIILAMQTHEHLHRDTVLRSAQKRRLFQRFPSGRDVPGGLQSQLCCFWRQWYSGTAVRWGSSEL